MMDSMTFAEQDINQSQLFISEAAEQPVLTTSESAHVMRMLMASIDLEELIDSYMEMLTAKLPCASLKLTFADQVLKMGKNKGQGRIMKISITYGHPYGTPQHAQLAYAFAKVLSPVQRKMLSEMHGLFAMSLRHALEFYRLSQLATKDVLTGLGNRSFFNETIEKQISQCKRQQSSFGLLVLDLDNFKSVNDIHGHQQGDEVLIGFANILKDCLRDTDHAFRFGGDEFCCVLTDVNRSANELVAARIKRSVENHIMFKQFGVSCSVGATSFESSDCAKTLFDRADKALYEAKEAGKNVYRAA
jgi:diguanylate cyclase (GGDEF)-like protein